MVYEKVVNPRSLPLEIAIEQISFFGMHSIQVFTPFEVKSGGQCLQTSARVHLSGAKPKMSNHLGKTWAHLGSMGHLFLEMSNNNHIKTSPWLSVDVFMCLSILSILSTIYHVFFSLITPLLDQNGWLWDQNGWFSTGSSVESII